MSHSQSQSHSRWQRAIEIVKMQLEFDSFDKSLKPMADELVKIISEIYILNPEMPVKISGENIPADMVQAVYASLTHENAVSVLNKFSEITYPVRSPKAYFRTALYNEAFEGNSKTANEVSASGMA